MRPALHVVVDPRFEAEVDPSFVETVAEQSVGAEACDENLEMTVHVTGDEEIRGLNKQYRNVDRATDVLSFGSTGDIDDRFSLPPGSPRQLGDVVVSLPRAQEQARQYGHGLDRELAWLIVHGTLQLFGYHHDTEDQARIMRMREEVILDRLGLPRG